MASFEAGLTTRATTIAITSARSSSGADSNQAAAPQARAALSTAATWLEHVGQRGEPVRRRGKHAVDARSHLAAGPRRQRLQQLTRNEPQRADRRTETRFGPEPLHEHPRERVQYDQHIGCLRRQEVRILVAQRKNGRILARPSGASR